VWSGAGRGIVVEFLRPRTVAFSLNRLWRLLMTGCCLVLFSLGGLLMSLVWFNVLLVLQRDASKRRQLARRGISASFRLLLGSARFLGVLDYRIDGIAALQSDQGCLVVANHPTLIDYVLLASVMPDVDCLIKASLLHNFFFRGMIRAADYLVNSQGKTLVATCRQRLLNGDTIMIFPEGTRTPYGSTPVLKRGAANIAVRCGCDLRVVHIHCTERVLTKQSRWYQIPPVKPFFTVSVRERISISTFMAKEEMPLPIAVRQLNRYLQQALTPEIL